MCILVIIYLKGQSVLYIIFKSAHSVPVSEGLCLPWRIWYVWPADMFALTNRHCWSALVEPISGRPVHLRDPYLTTVSFFLNLTVQRISSRTTSTVQCVYWLVCCAPLLCSAPLARYQLLSCLSADQTLPPQPSPQPTLELVRGDRSSMINKQWTNQNRLLFIHKFLSLQISTSYKVVLFDALTKC